MITTHGALAISLQKKYNVRKDNDRMKTKFSDYKNDEEEVKQMPAMIDDKTMEPEDGA